MTATTATATATATAGRHVDDVAPRTRDRVASMRSRTLPPSASAPSAPTDLAGSATSTTRIDLRWSDTSSDELGFRVLRCTGNRCSPVLAVATLPAGTTSWTDPGVVARTTYRYRVEAFNVAGSAASSVATVKTPRR